MKASFREKEQLGGRRRRTQNAPLKTYIVKEIRKNSRPGSERKIGLDCGLVTRKIAGDERRPFSLFGGGRGGTSEDRNKGGAERKRDMREEDIKFVNQVVTGGQYTDSVPKLTDSFSEGKSVERLREGESSVGHPVTGGERGKSNL